MPTPKVRDDEFSTASGKMCKKAVAINTPAEKLTK
jgi:hypothetical protein